jgi:hypothetical protein
MWNELQNAFALSRSDFATDPERAAARQAIEDCVAAGNVALICVEPVFCCFTDAYLGRAERLVSAHPSLDAAEAALGQYVDEDAPDLEVRYELRHGARPALRSSYSLYHPELALRICFELKLDGVEVWEGRLDRDGDWAEDRVRESREAARARYRELLAAGWLTTLPGRADD